MYVLLGLLSLVQFAVVFSLLVRAAWRRWVRPALQYWIAGRYRIERRLSW